jgi:aspartate 1-decarboxylase
MRWMLRSKINRATVTEANVDYIGSITIDAELIAKTGLWPGEKVLVTSLTTGKRLETYVIKGKPGQVCMNGAAALAIRKGEKVIIMSFELTDKKIKAKNILVDEGNRFVRFI